MLSQEQRKRKSECVKRHGYGRLQNLMRSKALIFQCHRSPQQRTFQEELPVPARWRYHLKGHRFIAPHELTAAPNRSRKKIRILAATKLGPEDRVHIRYYGPFKQ